MFCGFDSHIRASAWSVGRKLLPVATIGAEGFDFVRRHSSVGGYFKQMGARKSVQVRGLLTGWNTVVVELADTPFR
jgi:hypothetical protein